MRNPVLFVFAKNLTICNYKNIIKIIKWELTDNELECEIEHLCNPNEESVTGISDNLVSKKVSK